jgi:hypothetical protein
LVKKTMKSPLSVKLVCLLAFTLLLPVAQASVLSGGGSVAPSPLFPGGTLVATTSGTITTPTFSANFTQWVFADPFNSWCTNCLDFVYQFTNNGPDINERYSMSSFAGFLVDVGTSPFGLNDPSTVNRSLGAGAVIGFNYTPGIEIQPGVTTPWLVIETDATAYKWGFVSAQDGTAGSASAYIPAVPEPSSLALIGGGLSAFGLLLRKFRFRKSV